MPNIAEPATNGGADEPVFAITIAVQTFKTEVDEAADKILNIWTHAIFLIYHIGDKRMLRRVCASSMRRQIFKPTKKQDVYNVAANQILNWHIYILFTTSEISYKPNHCRHLAWVFAVRMYSDSYQVPLYARHNNTHTNVKALSSYWLTQHIFENIFISCIKKDKFEQLRKILILTALASSEDSDKPAHTRSFARVITAHTHKVGTYMGIQAKI